MFLKIGITQPKVTPGEADRIEELLSSGVVDIIHLRHPEANEEDMRRLIERIDPVYYHQLKLHSFSILAEEYNLRGVHLKSAEPICQSAADQSRVSRFVEGEGACLSRSCHSFSELDELLKLEDQEREKYEYVFLSPIYDSISKAGYESKFLPTEELEALLKGKYADLNVIALGGVTPDRFPELKRAGFSGAAMLGHLRACFIKQALNI